ncbi:SCO6880 family protein [Solwaraspora sp. WMMB335]|uniref:SCO6880 family protein n=1 Tax=Solwaraspora sp. WMMB335 TaxID=3404118 RepID=UPI003B923A53
MTGTTTERGRVYSGWRRETFGWFMGLDGIQLGLVTAAVLPVFVAGSQSDWGSAARFTPISAITVALVVVPIRGRPAARWFFDLLMYSWGRAMGWSLWRSAASTGTATPKQLQSPDLPGALAALRLHDGPPYGPLLHRVCIIQEPKAGRWSATAQLTHPGLGAVDHSTRDAYANQLGSLLEAAARGEHISRVSILIRTVPDDGAERVAWVLDNVSPDAPDLARQVALQLEDTVVSAAVRHEVYVTIGVSEARIRRSAAQIGKGVNGRARVLYRHLQEVEGHLRGMGATRVRWLHTEDVAAAIRTGYNLGEAMSLEAARQEAARGRPTITGVPVGAAGPVAAPIPAPRSYTHDGYTTVSFTLLLPELPTMVGALAQLLAPSAPGERRTLALHYEPRDPAKASREVEQDIWRQEMAADVRHRRGMRIGRADQRRAGEVAAHEHQLAAGHTMVRMAGAASVTVPAEWPVDDHAARFEADARACLFRLLRLDLAHDTGFVAACLPLGIGLPDRGVF